MQFTLCLCYSIAIHNACKGLRVPVLIYDKYIIILAMIFALMTFLFSLIQIDRDKHHAWNCNDLEK